MIATTFNDQSVWLLPYGPMTGRAMLRLSLPVSLERGVTSAEARGALGHTLRCELSWRAFLPAAAQAALENAGKVRGNDPLITPAWPFLVAGSAWTATEVKGGLILAWMRGWTSWTLTTTLTSPASWDYVAPALMGFLAKDPETRLRQGELAVVEFEFIEDGPATYALTLPTRTWLTGPALNDGTVPLIFPVRINWEESPILKPSAVVIERGDAGPGRQRPATVFPQPADRVKRGRFTGSDAQIATLLAWFRDRRGNVNPHLVATDSAVTALAADAASGATTITLAAATRLGSHRWLGLANALQIEYLRVSSLSGNVATLTAPLVKSWSAATTRVSAALFARHLKAELEMEFTGPRVAVADLAWREVSAELALATGETRGTTLGALPVKGWLYELTEDYGGGVTVVTRVTSHERDVTASSQTWTARPGLSHSEIRQNLKLDRDEVQLEGRYWAGSAVDQFLPGRLSAVVLLAIFECDVDAAGAGANVAQKFGGEVSRCGFDAADFKLSAAGFYALFDRPGLCLKVQRACNAVVFQPLCGLAEAAWTFTATVVSVSGDTMTLGSFTRTGGLPSGFGFAHWFALGYAQRTVSWRPQRFAIFDSAALSSGQITLTLDRAISPTPVAGDTWSVVPGCDGRAQTCKAWAATNIVDMVELGNPEGKFDHFADFKGFPDLPDKDPALQPLPKDNSAAGKK